jgi:hypothetical protein
MLTRSCTTRELVILNRKLERRYTEMSQFDQHRFSAVDISSALENIYFLRFL